MCNQNCIGNCVAKFSAIMDKIKEESASINLSEVDDSTLADMLMCIDAKTAAGLLDSLPSERQAKVITMAVKAERTEEGLELLYKIKDSLNENLSSGYGRSNGVAAAFKGDSLRKVAEILKRSTRRTERFVLEAVQEEDPAFAEEIRKNMFLFSDLARVGSHLQKVLQKADPRMVAIALSGAEDHVREDIYANLSERVGRSFQEDADKMGDICKSEVEEAQQYIINLVRTMQDSGEIVIGLGVRRRKE